MLSFNRALEAAHKERRFERESERERVLEHPPTTVIHQITAPHIHNHPPGRYVRTSLIAEHEVWSTFPYTQAAARGRAFHCVAAVGESPCGARLASFYFG